MSKTKTHHSLRFRILSLAIIIVVSVVAVMFFFILKQLETVTIYAVEHEGVLLSNTLESEIDKHVINGNIAEIQNYIDRLVTVRDKNDIEINVMLLMGKKSAIVASNNSENLKEETSDREHSYLIKSLKNKNPVLFIDEEDAGDEQDHQNATLTDPSHPDYYFQPGQRFISISTPLFDSDQRGLGSINIKLSLFPLDQRISVMRRGLSIIIFCSIFIMLLGLNYMLNKQIFHPLEKMIAGIKGTKKINLQKQLPIGNMKGELFVLAHEFNKMMSRIHKLMIEMKAMTNNIAHDLRGPITRIRGFAEVALTMDSSLEEYKNVTVNTIEECEQILIIINSILYFAEVESGMLKLELQDVNISKMLNEACGLLQSVAEEKNISITTDIPEDCILSGNTSMLQRVVANLLDNSIKYTNAGGRISISVRCEKKMAVIYFADNGIGISHEDIPHIFTRFYRCSQSRSNPGIGLGLSLCSAIVNSHHGSISVESSLGKGSTFVVKLPTG